jgi:hypothetical protein
MFLSQKHYKLGQYDPNIKSFKGRKTVVDDEQDSAAAASVIFAHADPQDATKDILDPVAFVFKWRSCRNTCVGNAK